MSFTVQNIYINNDLLGFLLVFLFPRLLQYQENCLAAKSLFSSFCLPPECLQTELLPYLAKLANPMRNQGKMGVSFDLGLFFVIKAY